jgi:hypothetical protein
MPLAARVSALLTLSLLVAAPLHAQEREPVPIFAVDLRGFYSGLGQDATTASDLGVGPYDLPARGLGAVAGVQVYPLRGRTMALGIGAEWMMARGKAQQSDPATGEPIGLPIEQRLRSLSPQVSLNFGHREGWSFLSAGIGPLSFETFQGELPPAEPPPSQATINLGGGARWFATAHVAFAFDARFYLTGPEDASELYPGRERTRLFVLSAGLAFK